MWDYKLAEEHILSTTTISEDKLKKSIAYIHGYVEEICDVLDIQLQKSEHERTTKILYRAYLDFLIESKTENNDIEDLFYDTLDDFDSGGKLAIGNILLLCGRANSFDETQEPLIALITNSLISIDYN